MLNGAPATLTAADNTNTLYNGESGGALFALTIHGTQACITSYPTRARAEQRDDLHLRPAGRDPQDHRPHDLDLAGM